MLELQTPDKIFAFGASPSMVSLWQLCKHKWWLHYVARQGRETKEAQKDSGVAIHKFFQSYYGEGFDFAKAIEQFKLDFPQNEENEKREQDHIINVLKNYGDTYPIASEPFKVLTREQVIQVPLPDCKIGLNVKLDMTATYLNGLWVVDHKSSNQLGNQYFEQFRNHWQTYTYIYAGGVYHKQDCQGIMYNAVGLKKKIDRDSFLRQTFSKTKDQLDYHIKEFAKIVNSMYSFVEANWQNVEAFEMTATPTACRAYHTNCPFLDYCEFNRNERMLP